MNRIIRATILNLVIISACGNLENHRPVQNADNSKQLFNTEWVLAGFESAIEENREVPVSGSSPMIIFGMEESRIFGSGGCNRYSGAYVLESENSLRFQNVISTKMACPEMKNETDYFHKLNQVRSFTFSEDFSELFLLNDSGGILLTFARTELHRS